jgi:hypothetical protein
MKPQVNWYARLLLPIWRCIVEALDTVERVGRNGG